MKFKIMIMALLMVSAVGIGSAVNRLPATEFVGDVDMGGYSINDINYINTTYATISTPPYSYDTMVSYDPTTATATATHKNGSVICENADNSTVIQAAVDIGGTTLLADLFVINTTIILDEVESGIPMIQQATVSHRLVGLGSHTGLYVPESAGTGIHAIDPNGDSLTGAGQSYNYVILENFRVAMVGAANGIRMDNIGNAREKSAIRNMVFTTIGSTNSGSCIELLGVNGWEISGCSIVGYASIANVNRLGCDKVGIKVSTNATAYMTSIGFITNNRIAYMRNGISITGHNLSTMGYCCGFNIVNNIIIGCDRGINIKYADSPIIALNILDNNNNSIVLENTHAPQIVGNQIGDYLNDNIVTGHPLGAVSILNSDMTASGGNSGAIISSNRFMTYGTDTAVPTGFTTISIRVTGGSYSGTIISNNEMRNKHNSMFRLVATGAGVLNDTMIIGNSMITTSGGTGPGIVIATAAVGNTYIALNTIRTGGSSLSDSGVGTVAVHNLGLADR